MKKRLTDNQPLTLPIHLYPLKRNILWGIILLALTVLLAFYSIIHPITDVTNSRYLPMPMQMILFSVALVISLWAMRAFYYILRSSQPIMVLEHDKLTKNDPLKKTSTDYYWQDIKEISFGYGRTSRIYVYLKDQPLLSEPKKLGLQMNYIIDDGEHHQTINNREVTDIINQLHKASLSVTESKNEPNVSDSVKTHAPTVYFHSIRQKLRDAF